MSTNDALPIDDASSATESPAVTSPRVADVDVKIPKVPKDSVKFDDMKGAKAKQDVPPKAVPPMPTAFKYGLPLLLLVIVCGGLFLSYFLSSGDNEGDEIAAADPVYSLGGGGAELTGASPDAYSESQGAGPTNDLDLLSGLSVRLDDVESSLGRLRNSVSTIDTPLAGVKSHLASLELESERVSGLSSQFGKQLENLESLTATLQTTTSGIRQDLSRLQGRVNKNTRALKAKAQRVVSRPPFRLVSVDEWGGEYSAVLEMSGASSVASVGDSRAGWVIRRIDRSGCILVTRIDKPSMKAVKVCKETL